MTTPSYIPAPAADFVLPFDLPKLAVRGRLVRLSAVSARALSAHALPEAAARVAAEAMTLSALLGSALKLDGRLTVQTKSDGALDLVAADYFGSEVGGAEAKDSEQSRAAGLRATARADEAVFKALGNAPSFAALAGAGSLAITIEPKIGGQTYQGIVALSPDGIAASAQTYFAQSEQLATALKIAAAPVLEPGKPTAWRAGGLMLQSTAIEVRGDDGKEELRNDDWERVKLFVDTVTDYELVDTALPAEDLLWRLFHEDEIRVLPFEPLSFRCDCSAARIESVLRSYPAEQRAGLADPDGFIRARCEFCGAVHSVNP